MNIITPISIAAAMIGAGTTIAEPAAGETLWVSGHNYTVGEFVIRLETHRKYKCAVDHTSGSTTAPELDPTKWVDVGPTLRHAPFDIYTSTAATAVTSMTYVLTPGFFNALAFYGLVGSQIVVTLKDAPGGAVLYTETRTLSEDPAGWYEYLFSPFRPISQITWSGLPIRPTAELTITITAASGQPVGVGMIVPGDKTPLFGSMQWGGTEYGAKAEPVTYSYIKANNDGTTSIVRGHHATNLRCTVSMPRSEADSALQAVQQVLDVPVAWIATDVAGFRGLNVFGLGSASMSYDSFGTATLEINVKGFI